jgi:hypothetical protein
MAPGPDVTTKILILGMILFVLPALHGDENAPEGALLRHIFGIQFGRILSTSAVAQPYSAPFGGNLFYELHLARGRLAPFLGVSFSYYDLISFDKDFGDASMWGGGVSFGWDFSYKTEGVSLAEISPYVAYRQFVREVNQSGTRSVILRPVIAAGIRLRVLLFGITIGGIQLEPQIVLEENPFLAMVHHKQFGIILHRPIE